MLKIKKIFTLTIIGLFIFLVFMPTMAIGKTEKPSLQIIYNDIDGNPCYANIELTESQRQIAENSWNVWSQGLLTIREDGKIDETEENDMCDNSANFLQSIKEIAPQIFPNFDISKFVRKCLLEYIPIGTVLSTFFKSFLFMYGYGAKIFLIGRGSTWLPFQRQGEIFIGSRINPIFIENHIGFTRVRFKPVLSLCLSISNWLFIHNVIVAKFTGLYINLANLFLNSDIGVVILIGTPHLIFVRDG